ncbi:SDR family oxidoreductase [Ignavibacterium sp.]|uniref:SDR family oxidoreductase n=1 Tax=Ignavibacterium sp. TaxID=2651167 RepID=UPI00307F9A2F
MNERICLITGATSGIGKSTAFGLAESGYSVILLGRNEQKCKQVSEHIKKKTGNEKVKYYVADISLIKDVKKISGRIKNDFNRLDFLINNAGARFLNHQLTDEGIEITLATNHLGHFILTNELLPLLQNSDDPRIINISSGVHYGGKGVIKNITDPAAYDGRKQYSDSKLANVLFTYELAERLKENNVKTFVVDPGGVATNFSRNNGLKFWLKHLVYYLLKRQLISPKKASRTIIYLATSDEVKNLTAKFYYEMKEKKSADISYDKSLQKSLWEMSEELIRKIN